MINIQRSEVPKHKFKYNDEDIKQKIREDFYHLCYICEENVSVSFEIDHFYPKGIEEFKHLEHNWDNLFCICSKCNKERPKDINTNDKEVLNNCKDDVEKKIGLKFEKIKTGTRIQITPNAKDIKTKNTVKLLNRIYNGIGAPDKNKRSHIYRREAIEKKIVEFEVSLEKYRKNEDLFEDIIKDRLSKKPTTGNNMYVSFKRQIIREKFPVLEKYFD